MVARVGLVLLVIHDDARLKDWVKIALTFVICAVTFPSDWSCVAAMAILFMGQARGDFRKQMGWLMVWSAVYALVYFFFIDKVYALVQLGTALAIPLLRCYDGTRGKWRGMGWLFYVYYPAHLALIGVLRVLLWGAGRPPPPAASDGNVHNGIRPDGENFVRRFCARRWHFAGVRGKMLCNVRQRRRRACATNVWCSTMTTPSSTAPRPSITRPSCRRCKSCGRTYT